MLRYGLINEKEPREIVLLRGRGCFYKKCAFCDYHLDASPDDEANRKLNQSVLSQVTGQFHDLEVINSGSFHELGPQTLDLIKQTAKEKDINILHFEAHYLVRNKIPQLREFFQGTELRLKVGLESFDENLRENILKKGMPNVTPEEVADLATTLVKEAKKESLANHTYYLPTNLGDLVLQNTPPSDPDTQKTYDLIQQRLPRLRNEGVTDKDVKWWWNFSQIERSMIIKNDEMEYHNFFVTQLLKIPKKETAQNAAHALTNKRFPIYTQHLQDDVFSPDDPLPYELKDRVDSFMDHAARFTDFQQTLQQIQQFSTFNAFVRQQITDKRL